MYGFYDKKDEQNIRFGKNIEKTIVIVNLIGK